MNNADLVSISRLTRAIAELVIHSHGAMTFSVATSLTRNNSITTATDVARAMGIGVEMVALPLPASQITVAEIGRNVSEGLSRISGPAIVLLYAPAYDGSQRQHDVIAGCATLAREAWSVNGETFLLIVTADGLQETMARLAGEAIGEHNWQNRIAL